MTYVERKIRITLTNAQSNGATGGGQAGAGAQFENLRVLARIEKAGGNYMGTAQITVYGLSLDHISQFSTWGTMYHPTQNYLISIEAGDAINGYSLVFLGNVQQAWADFSGMPDVPMIFLAIGTTAPANVGPASPTSFSGSTPVAPLIQKLAATGGLKFENSGVNSVLESGYYWGSPWKQIKEISDSAGINVFQDDGVATIWPQGGARNGDDLLVSSETGLRDYPTFTQFGVVVKIEFSKAITYGAKMTIKSDLKPANGSWQIIGIDYDLQSQVPNGNWFAILSGIQLGAPVTVAPK